MERGETLINIFNDPAKNQCIALPQDGLDYDTKSAKPSELMFTAAQGPQPPSDLRFSAKREWLFQIGRDADERVARGEPLLPPMVSPVYPIVPGQHVELRLVP